MRRMIGLVLLFPLLALAQDNPDPVGVVDNMPQSSAFWGAFLTIVAFPFLARGLNFLFDLFISWRKAKGDKKAEAYARLYALAGDAIAYVNAKTKATIEVIRSPDSPAGSGVTAEEAKQYQDAARKALMEWLGTEGFKAAVAEVGIVAGMAEEWIKALIQKRFENQRILEDMAPAPVVDVAPPAVP